LQVVGLLHLSRGEMVSAERERTSV